MTNRVYTMTKAAMDSDMDWDTAIYNNEIETVEEFDSIDEAIAYFENELGGNAEVYGVE